MAPQVARSERCSVHEHLQRLTAAGVTDPQVLFTHQVADGLHGAIVRATKPAARSCAPTVQVDCCGPAAEADCGGTTSAHEPPPPDR